MIETFEYPKGGRLSDRCLKGQTLSGGRNGLAICRAIVITALTDYLVIRPVTSRDAPQANTFIDIPPDPDLIENIGRHLIAAAGTIRRERCDAAYQAAIAATHSDVDHQSPE
ncbi:MAG: hypothetical protein ACR2QH_04045 [Geminicoccaceae bacterium]